MHTWSSLGLLPEHATELMRCAVEPDVAGRMGIRSIRTLAELPACFRRYGEAIVPAILFQYVSPAGQVMLQVKPDRAYVGRRWMQGDDGEMVEVEESKKYIQEDGKSCMSATRPLDEYSIVLIVEGTKQALAAAAHAPDGVYVLGMTGCWGWSIGRKPKPDLSVCKGKAVVVAMDADVETSRSVYEAAERLAQQGAAEAGMASLTFVRVPAVAGDRRTGLDDLLASVPRTDRAALLAALIRDSVDFGVLEDPRGPSMDELGDCSSMPERVEYDPTVLVPEGTYAATPEWVAPGVGSVRTREGDASDMGVAKAVRAHLDALFPGRVRRGFGCLWLYEDGVWRKLPDAWLSALAKAFHRKVYTKGERGQKFDWTASVGPMSNVCKLTLLGFLEDQGFDDLPFEKKGVLAVFGKRTIYREDGKLFISDNDPSFGARHKFEFEFESGRQPSWLLRVMREDWFGGVEEGERERRIQLIREFMGHCMLGSMPLVGSHKMLVCVGHANDGKSVLMRLARMCMPPGSTCSVQIQEMIEGLEGGANNRAQLEGKTANFIDDMGSDTIKENGPFKSATSFNAISGRFLGGNKTEFVPRAAWWANVNPVNGELPKLAGKSEGMLRRLICVEFPRSVSKAGTVANIEERIAAHEIQDVVCWAVEAALEMLQTRRSELTTPACSAEILDSWKKGTGSGSSRDDELSVPGFARGACVDPGPDQESWTACSELYESYCRWVKKMGGSKMHVDRALVPYNAFMHKLKGAGVFAGIRKNGPRGGIGRDKVRLARLRMLKSGETRGAVTRELSAFVVPGMLPLDEKPILVEVMQTPALPKRASNVIDLHRELMGDDDEQTFVSPALDAGEQGDEPGDDEERI